jgi:excisionase family DNA binding protein
MGRPSIKVYKYLTTTKVAKELGVDHSTVVRWIDEGVVPEPPKMEGTTRLFDELWLTKAREIAKKIREGRES